ncbi:MAG: thioredoxin domain-containing protein [Microbacterium sp.]|nr:thioredoxin domain-containing protein [Microbacterium sp.]
MASRLADAASPYLRAHAGNPVAWFPWASAAFAEAERRDVPVMVSIGYSTCHWCHVMARESFDDPQTARELNDGFVAIKVDREEHPEVDDAYLAAASAFTPHLGWPLTVFTTPEGRAFFAGTYFPPEPRGGVPAFRKVLAAVSEAWRERRDELLSTADAVADALAAATVRAGSVGESPALARLADAARRALEREDPEYGGFAPPGASVTTPKFPTVPALRFLQAPALAEEVPDAAAVAARAVAAMAASPLRDGVDGGFFRYATRRDWTVPHYERMLTDNAGLIEVALDAGATEVARGIANFLLDVLQRENGGFAAAALSLWLLGAGERYREAAASVVRDHAAAALAEPLANGAMLRIAAQLAVPPRQVVVVGAGPDADALAAAAATLTADVFAVATAAQADAFADAGFTLFDGKAADGPLAYDCRDFACRLPAAAPAELQSAR